jgi:hypothetical protein
MLLYWMLAEPDPGGGGTEVLNNLPADPVRAWAVIILVALMTVGPLIKASLDAKKTKSEEKKSESKSGPSTSVVIGGSVTPHIDASQQLLATVVGNVEERAREIGMKYDELERRHVVQVRELARSELQVELLTKRVAELETEVNILNGRLRERYGQ